MSTGEHRSVRDGFRRCSDVILANPTTLVVGAAGTGKSTFVKCLVCRSLRARRRGAGLDWVAILDAKGEYGALAEALGLPRVRLYPGGPERLNPLDDPGGPTRAVAEVAFRRAAVVGALVAVALERELTQTERAALRAAVDHLPTGSARSQPTLAAIAHLVATPTATMAQRAGCDLRELVASVTDARWALGWILDRALRGMFDGPSTVRPDWAGRGLVLDLSALYRPRLAAVAASAWMQAHVVVGESPGGPRRCQVVDEGWLVSANHEIPAFLAHCWQRSARCGVSSIFVTHRIADLGPETVRRGEATTTSAVDLMAHIRSSVIFAQSPRDLDQTRRALRLSDDESALVPRLSPRQALWRAEGRPLAVVLPVVGADHVAVGPLRSGLALPARPTRQEVRP